jgi:hypothetical protein
MYIVYVNTNMEEEMKKLKDLGFKKVRGTSPGFHMWELTPARLDTGNKPQATSHKLQAASDKHLTNLDKGLYRMYESKRSR